MTTTLKQYEISVLLIEPDPKKRKVIEEILEYVGLSGRDIRDVAVNEERAEFFLTNRTYHFVIGTLPSGHSPHLTRAKVIVPAPERDDAEDYLRFQERLMDILEKSFGFNYDH